MKAILLVIIWFGLAFGLSAQVEVIPVEIDTVIEEQDYLTASNPDGGDYFGNNVAIDGDTMVVGSPYEDSDGSNANDNSVEKAGAVYVYVRQNGSWTQQAYLKASNPDELDLFGYDVAISGDTLVVGAPGEDSAGSDPNDNSVNNAGAVYIFERENGIWTQDRYLKASSFDIQDSFGNSVDIDGNLVVVGAPGEDSDGSDPSDNSLEDSGAVYVFLLSVFTVRDYIKADDADEGDRFGEDVAIDNEIVVVGAAREDSNGTGPSDNSLQWAGAAYVFERNLSNDWSQRAYLKAGDPDNGDRFGTVVDIDAGNIVIGAWAEDGNGGSETNNSVQESGAAYVYAFNEINGWVQQAYLKASNLSAGDYFGMSVAVDRDVIVVGAYNEDSNGTSPANDTLEDSGAAYVFMLGAGGWEEQNYLKASNLSEGANFGWGVTTQNNTIGVGAVLADAGTTDFAGAVYVLDISEFSGDPVPPGPLTMVGPPGQPATTTFTVDNRDSGSFLLTVSLSSITNGYSVTDGLPISGLAGSADPATVTIQCDDPGTTPTNGVLVLQSNALGDSTYTYDLVCTAQGTPVPSETPTTEPTPSETPTTEPTPSETPTTEPTPSETPTTEPTPSETPTTQPTPSVTPTTQPTAGIQRIAPADGTAITTGDQYVSQFQWQAVQDADWYAVYVATPDYTTYVFFEWYEASQVCDNNGLCTTPDSIWLPQGGQFEWWMTYWSPGMTMPHGDLWEQSTFSVDFPAPGNLVGSAAANGGNVTLQWDVASNALWYQVWVGTDNYNETAYLGWVNAADACAGSACTFSLPDSLTSGNYEFWLRAWNPVGMTAWTQITTFSVTP